MELDAKGQRAVRVLIGLLTSNFGRGVSGMARCWTGRIAVTEHIPGLSAYESRTHARGRRKGDADPGVTSGWAARLHQGRDGGDRLVASWMVSERRGCMPLGEWSGQAARCASRDRFNGLSAFLADLRSAPPSAAIHADRLATYGGMAPAEASKHEVGCRAWIGEHQLDSAPACSPGCGIINTTLLK